MIYFERDLDIDSRNRVDGILFDRLETPAIIKILERALNTWDSNQRPVELIKILDEMKARP